MTKQIRLWQRVGLVLLFTLGATAEVQAQEASIQEADTLQQQVERLYNEGRYKDALPAAQRALAIREKVLGPEHPGDGHGAQQFAELYRATGAYAQAEPLYQRALAIRKKSWGRSIRPRPRRSTIWLPSIVRWGYMPRQSRSISGRWRSMRKSWGRSIRTRPRH